MKSLLVLAVALMSSYIKSSSAIPVAQHQYCPVIKESDLDSSLSPTKLGSKVIRMDEVEGNKVRLQFYYPSVHRRRQIESGEASTTIQSDIMNIETTTGNNEPDDGTTLIPQVDIFCQWDFRAGNASQFLLLTFEKLSAPYSENCAEAFVAMQKENGYESRWCGNRRQANARSMSLFSRGSAKVTVFKSSSSPVFPTTGFTVVVESVDMNTAYDRILGYLPEKEIRRLRFVCKRWDLFFRDKVGLRLVVTSSNERTLAEILERDRALSHLRISNVTSSLGSLVPWGAKNYLTSLTFHKIVTSVNIFWAINRFKCLQSLTFSYVMLNTCMAAVNLEKCALPHLRTVTLFSKTATEKDADNNVFADSPMTKRAGTFPPDEEYIFLFLCGISCKNLSRINLFCSENLLTSQPFGELFDGRPFSRCTSGITKLISKNKMSLQEFFAGETHLVTLAWSFRPEQILWQTGMQLTHCDSFLSIPTDWTTMLTVQRNLEFIRLNSAYKHWTSLQVGIRKSHKTIREIRLAGGGHGSSVDLQRFDKCEKLVRLDVSLDDCYLKNAHFLPASLRHLHLNGPMTEDDLQAIAMKLENLEYFYLFRNLPSYKCELYGDQFVLPATITKKVLKGFLTLPKIYSLTFHDTKMEVVDLQRWLGTIENIEVDFHPVPEHPQEFYGSLKITVPVRYYSMKY